MACRRSRAGRRRASVLGRRGALAPRPQAGDQQGHREDGDDEQDASIHARNAIKLDAPISMRPSVLVHLRLASQQRDRVLFGLDRREFG